MKANRRFVNADEAVSPVIAVILMVAITVVLAATVFVLVSDIGSDTARNAPQMGWADDESGDLFQVTQAPQQLEWLEFQLKVSGNLGDVYVAWNAEADDAAADCQLGAAYTEIADCPAPGNVRMPASTGATATVNAGDAFRFCSTATSPLDEDVTVTVLHDVSNAVSHTFTFSSLQACP